MLEQKTFLLSREGEKRVAEQEKIVLKSHANFFLEIHIFFSNLKNVNRLRKKHVSQVIYMSLSINGVVSLSK